MKVIIGKKAQDDLDRIAEWIGRDNPRAAASTVARIRDQIDFLQEDNLVHMGRPGLVAGTRELIEHPYIIVYEVHDDRGEVYVLSIIHGARRR